MEIFTTSKLPTSDLSRLSGCCLSPCGPILVPTYPVSYLHFSSSLARVRFSYAPISICLPRLSASYLQIFKMAASTAYQHSRSSTSTACPSYRPTTTASRPATKRSRPRTSTTSIAMSDNEIICSISESRGVTPTIGLSFVNISTCETAICQFSDTQTYARTCHKITVFSPSEIIYMSTSADSELVSIIRENLEVEKNNILMTSVDRRYWNEAAGHEYLEQLAFPADLESLSQSMAGNYFATCCFASVRL